MAETLFVPTSASRKEIYEAILPQIKSVVESEIDLIANYANVSAILKKAFGFFWVGFYRLVDSQLVLGPFQGELACTRMPISKGVCGASATKKETIIVPDVDVFPSHIACSSISKSEIVVPVYKQAKLIGVLDIDSDKLDDFSELDQYYLEQIVQYLDQ
jgi:GAF domain-containing protein